MIKRKDDTERLVYRGMNLTDEMLEEYKQAVGTKIKWLSFTSTSTDRRIAEEFGGNTLFIIQIIRKGGYNESAADISSISFYSHEQEVLLSDGYILKVDRLERDSTSGKYLIYMTAN